MINPIDKSFIISTITGIVSGFIVAGCLASRVVHELRASPDHDSMPVGDAALFMLGGPVLVSIVVYAMFNLAFFLTRKMRKP